MSGQGGVADGMQRNDSLPASGFLPGLDGGRLASHYAVGGPVRAEAPGLPAFIAEDGD